MTYALDRDHIGRIIRDGLPPGIIAACTELLLHAIDDDAGYLLVAGASLLVEPWAYPKPAIPLPPMRGQMPHAYEIASFVRRHSTARIPQLPAMDAVEIWRSCPTASHCRVNVRHAVRTLHVHMAMPEYRGNQPNSINRELRAVCVAASGCLLNPAEEIA